MTKTKNQAIIKNNEIIETNTMDIYDIEKHRGIMQGKELRFKSI